MEQYKLRGEALDAYGRLLDAIFLYGRHFGDINRCDTCDEVLKECDTACDEVLKKIDALVDAVAAKGT